MAGGRIRRSWRSLLLIGLAAPLSCQGGAGGCNGPVDNPTQVNASSSGSPDFYVLADRQKFIGLTAYVPGVEYDSLSFSVITPPESGQLLGTAPNLVYVPNPGFGGKDSLTYQAVGGGVTFQRTLQILVDSTFHAPTGIPQPEFGVVQSHTMYSGAQFDFGGSMENYRDAGNGPYTHYVDFNAGSDSGNPFGTVDNPRRTIPENLPAGSVVEVHGTNINYSTRINFTGSGTADKPIFIRGASPTAKPVFRRPVAIECNYIICENLEFDCQDFGPGHWVGVIFWVTNTQVAPFEVFHHVALRHSIIRDQPVSDGDTVGVWAGVGNFDSALNDANLVIDNVVVYDVEVRNFADWTVFNGSTDYLGCGFGGNSRNCYLLDCHIHHTEGDAAAASRANALGNQSSARRVFVGRNYLHNCKESCFDYKNVVDSVFSENIGHTCRVSSSSLGEAVTIHNDDSTSLYPASDNIWVIFNTLYDAEMGIHHENLNSLLGGQSRSYMVGNLIFDIRNIRGNPAVTGLGISKGQLAQSRIIGNTIYNCDQGIWLGLSTLTEPDLCTQVVRNNMIVDLTQRSLNSTGNDAMHIFVVPPTILPFTTIDHNLHFQSQGRVRFTIVKPGLIDVDYYTVEDLVAQTGLGGGSMIADPKFSAQSSGDFHLASDSPALSAGNTDDAYGMFQSDFGSPIDVYLDGSKQTEGSIDIGALGTTPS
ncbi:MAG TPA: Ig-like domain-containing protein [Phycisphaerae bacterium]|nr:Ig-like domain-containing protein [Phycisphaerae bacterium]